MLAGVLCAGGAGSGRRGGREVAELSGRIRRTPAEVSANTATAILTLDLAEEESEALVLGRLRLLLWILTVNSGDVSSLTAVVAASTVADPVAEHRGEDDLNAIQVGGEVGPCWQ